MTAKATAAILGISRRTLYRWAEEGRLHPWEWGDEEKMASLQKRKRGPKRDPRSLRYTAGRHDFVRTKNP